jgi:hypothetical protein
VEDTPFVTQREDLLQSIERDEEEMRVAVQQLADVAGAQLDVRERIKAFPLTWMLGAFLVGTWLGSGGAPGAVTNEQRRS